MGKGKGRNGACMGRVPLGDELAVSQAMKEKLTGLVPDCDSPGLGIDGHRRNQARIPSDFPDLLPVRQAP